MSMRSSSHELVLTRPHHLLQQSVATARQHTPPRLQEVLDEEQLGHVIVVETDDDTDVMRLLLRREIAAGAVEDRQQLVDGLLDVLHHVRLDDIDDHVGLRGGEDGVLVLRVLLQQLVPLLAGEVLLHIVDRGEHQSVLAEQLERVLQRVHVLREKQRTAPTSRFSWRGAIRFSVIDSVDPIG